MTAAEKPTVTDASKVEPGWQVEPWDVNIPKGGFIEDMVWATRGIETPTKFAVWGALMIISIALKRGAWMKWFPKELWPNLYVIFVAPPRICAKSTAVDFGEDALRRVHSYLTEKTKYFKQFNIHHSKATSEGLFDLLNPGAEQSLVLSDGKILAVKPISQVALIISELTTFINKQKYNVGLIDTLTKLYDSRDYDDEVTRGMGKKELKNTYVTLFGATTPDSYKESLPEEAFGGGFMTRAITVIQKTPTRYYPFPKHFSGTPSIDDLAKKLAWILETAIGEYELSKEAAEEYFKWYKPFKDSLVDEKNSQLRSRMDTNLMKIALLIRVQRYEAGNIITREDFLTAKRLLDDVYFDTATIVEDMNTSSYFEIRQPIENFISLKGEVKRVVLLAKFKREGVTPRILGEILDALYQEDLIRVFDAAGKEINQVTNDKMEAYRWKGTKITL